MSLIVLEVRSMANDSLPLKLPAGCWLPLGCRGVN